MNIFRKLGLTDNYGVSGFGMACIFGCAFVAIFVAVFSFDAVSCGQYGAATGRATEYRVPAGCFVQYGGHFIPQDEFNARAITHERQP